MIILQDKDILVKMKTNTGESVANLVAQSPILLVFLRHLGCVFCKEALSDLKRMKDKISELGTKIVLVHMADNQEAALFFKQYKVEGIHHVSDTNSEFYSSFGLSKGDFRQLFGFKSWLGMGRATLKGNYPSKIIGDQTQLPGIFLIKDNQVVKSFVYDSVGDYPDYLELANPS